MEEQVEAHFGQHPDAEIYLSQPGLGVVLGARVLAEFGDDKNRYADAKARKNYAGTSPITRQSGKKKIVLARYVHNDRLLDALGRQAFAALRASPGARAYYDQLRARGVGHRAALRQLGNRLVGILHGCLKTGTAYDEDTAWAHQQQDHNPLLDNKTHGMSDRARPALRRGGRRLRPPRRAGPRRQDGRTPGPARSPAGGPARRDDHRPVHHHDRPADPRRPTHRGPTPHRQTPTTPTAPLTATTKTTTTTTPTTQRRR